MGKRKQIDVGRKGLVFRPELQSPRGSGKVLSYMQRGDME